MATAAAAYSFKGRIFKISQGGGLFKHLALCTPTGRDSSSCNVAHSFDANGEDDYPTQTKSGVVEASGFAGDPCEAWARCPTNGGLGQVVYCENYGGPGACTAEYDAVAQEIKCFSYDSGGGTVETYQHTCQGI